MPHHRPAAAARVAAAASSSARVWYTDGRNTQYTTCLLDDPAKIHHSDLVAEMVPNHREVMSYQDVAQPNSS